MCNTLCELVERYVQVVNRALHVHNQRFPYNRILDVGERVLADRTLAIAVYQEDRECPDAVCTLRWRDGGLQLCGDAQPEPNLCWSQSSGYLRQVVANPQSYVDHPARLDWKWIATKLRAVSAQHEESKVE